MAAKNINKLSFRVAALITIIFLTLSLVTFVYSTGAGTTYTFSGGVTPGPSDYTVYLDSGTTYAKTGLGAIPYSSTNASYVLNSVLGVLSGSYQQIVYVHGNFSLTNSIVIQKNWTTLKLDGKLNAATGLNAPMIMQTENDTLYGVVIEGVGVGTELDGNSAGQTSDLASGLNFTRRTGALPTYVSPIPAIVVKNLYIQDCYSAGVYCNFDSSTDGGEISFKDVTVQNCVKTATDLTGGFGSGQVIWYGCMDSEWKDGLIGGDNTNFAFLGLTLSACKITPFYINGHSKILNFDGLTVEPGFSDNSGNFASLALYQGDSSRFGGVFNKAGGTNNTYPAISLVAYGTQNVRNDFSGITFRYYTTSSMFNYGIEETTSAQNFNTYGSLNGGCGNYTLRILGAGSNCTGAIVGGIAWT